jgi:acyl-CoA thioesterase-1
MPVKYRKFKSLFCHILAGLALSLVFAACQQAGKSGDQRPVIAANPEALNPAATTVSNSADLPAIVAFGDSLTAGYGLSQEESYTALLQRKVDENGYRFRVVNAGVSGDTSAGGARRIDWALEGNVKYLILELGGNDGLRGLPVLEMKKNLAAIIEAAQSRGVTVLLAGMEAPPNLGADYTRDFRQAYRDLAKKYNIKLIPFVLDGVGGRPEMNQPDGIHPNAAGEKVMTENVWRALEPLLAEK